MTKRQTAIGFVGVGVASFVVLLVGIALLSVPLALIVLGVAGLGASAVALLWDPDR